MFEKVNPCHPDKVADRIAGALVDLAYKKAENPRIAVEVLIGHGVCYIIAEASVSIPIEEITAAVHRIAGNLAVDYVEVPQDGHLAENQADGVRCGDNGIFKGMPVTEEQKKLSQIARNIFSVYPNDGKYILDGDRLILCQSNAETQHLREIYPDAEINPLGDWTGGTDVDTGATNRKLGSDMAEGSLSKLHRLDRVRSVRYGQRQQGRKADYKLAVGQNFLRGLDFRNRHRELYRGSALRKLGV